MTTKKYNPKPFQALEEKMSPQAREIAESKAKLILSELKYKEIRSRRGVTQEEVASRLGVKQAYISKLENRSDCTLSKLKKYFEALGGSAEIIVRFPDDQPVHIPL